MNRTPNRLADSSSPYLRQHADNPVDWWPWGPEPFAEARRRDVPVFLSVGYSTCHWCHVMARESFSDPDIAAQINDGFVPVKVDREQLPGVDAVYMQATQALSGQGGWPMTVITDADGRPFFAGTYFRPGQLRELLDALTRVWTTDRTQVTQVADRLTTALARASEEDQGTASWTAQDATAALPERIVAAGAGVVDGAPAFPPTAALLGLVRAGETDRAGETLHAMLRGGLFDQLGGGFHRYCVDAAWRVPHFEKTLYDNALLLRAMAAYLTDRPADLLVRRAAEMTVDFLTAGLGRDGLFASGLDADTDGVEGLTYTWTPEQVRAAMEAWRTRMPAELRRDPEEAESDARYAMTAFAVTDAGDVDGRSVLTYPHDVGYSEGERGEDLSSNEALPWEARGIIDDWKAGGDGGAAENLRMQRVRKALLAARRDRPRPGVDDKAVTAWNAMAAVALTEATGTVLVGDGEPAGAAATRALWDHAVLTDDDGTVLDVVRCTGEPASPGTLEDCAWLLLALVRAWEHGEDLVREVSELVRYIQLVFSRGRGTWYDGAASVAGTGVRPREPYDGATPAPVAVLAEALSYAGALAGTSQDADLRTLGGRWGSEARRILDAHTTVVERHLGSAGGWLCALTAHLSGPVTATVRGASDAQIGELRADLGTSALIVRTEDGAGLVGEIPGGSESAESSESAVVQICRAGVCGVAQPLPDTV
jgi:uncharacterized protein YyaL (SSP411 family)